MCFCYKDINFVVVTVLPFCFSYKNETDPAQLIMKKRLFSYGITVIGFSYVKFTHV